MSRSYEYDNAGMMFALLLDMNANENTVKEVQYATRREELVFEARRAVRFAFGKGYSPLQAFNFARDVLSCRNIAPAYIFGISLDAYKAEKAV